MKSIGRPRFPAVDEIKIFDNDIDDKATKHSFSLRMFCGLVPIIISSTAGGSGRPI